jgi:tetratricopeptide (TPR) repeat protein
VIDLGKRATPVIGLVLFLLSAAVYLITLSPSVPFWDSGEFIAVSYILGIPHPPGTPFYVMLGRLATMVPWATIAQRVNALSALASALAVLLTYLTTLRLIRLAQGRGPSGAPPVPGTGPGSALRSEWMAQAGALIGALMLAFSDNFWENAIEAEVYSMMSLAQILVFWLGLRWWESHEKRPTAGPLMVCVYVMWLSVGLHLGVGMMGLPLLVLVWLVDRRAAIVFAMPLLSVLGVTWGLERMAGIVLLFSTATFIVYAWQKKVNGLLVAAGAVCALIACVPAFGDANFDFRTGALALAAIALPLIPLARRTREGRVIALALFLMAAGYSTHAYLPIRAAQHPAINEGDPSSWESLRYLLERKQYGESRMDVRRGPLSAQLDKEFWRYWKRQWPIMQSPRLHGALGRQAEPRVWQYLLPMLLGLLGFLWQARRERISFLATSCLFAFATVGMIAFLNFTDHEVRDRDYFFTTGYHTFALLIGLGVTWLLGWVRDSFPPGSQQRAATGATFALLAAMPFLLLKSLWYTHDRRGNYVAHDYAYDMLAPIAPNGFVVTNGDNDTFPLWYIQQVEGVRKDVRVVNLSLLNTDWYIRQLRDDEPKVPIELSDDQIRTLGQGYVQDPETGRVVYTNQFMIGHIINVDRVDHGWKKQPYFAVTVPEHMGLDKHFSLEGLVYRVNPDTLGSEVDEPATRRNLYDVFKYRGLFNPDGSWDSTVYKDENAATLSRNYAAAHLQLAFLYRRQGKLDRAIAEMERVSRMFPDYTEVMIPLGGFYMDQGDTAKAVELFRRLTTVSPDNPEGHYYYGVTLFYRGQVDPAVREFERAIQLNPDYNLAYYAAYYALLQSGQRERALAYLQRWVDEHPTDTQARAMLDSERGAGRTPARVLPRPPAPVLP